MVQLAENERNSGPISETNSSNGTSVTNTSIDLQNEQSDLLGVAAVSCACVLSGFAGVYFKKIMKGADISMAMRNVQMSLLSIPFGLIPCFFQDFDKVISRFFSWIRLVCVCVCIW